MNRTHSEPKTDSCFNIFNTDISGIELPVRFTFPFYYTPHPLARLAAEEVMHRLEYDQITDHNFGLDPDSEGLQIGKMFGILVVQDLKGQIGYLQAFSGKLDNSNHLLGFVPPIFDMLDPDGFFIKGERELNQINSQIEVSLLDENYLRLLEQLKSAQNEAKMEIDDRKRILKLSKKDRDRQRAEGIQSMSESEFEALKERLKDQSLREQYELKLMQKEWNDRIQIIQERVQTFELEIQRLKEERKRKSNELQQQLFDQYNFLNISGDRMNVRQIFEHLITKNPPSGAGECATPKLLQYAFKHRYKPIAMAEFWWGRSPDSEIRKHKEFYPACRGKCEPILKFMLDGIDVDDNPMLQVRKMKDDLEIIYEDEHIVVINKPAEYLSVPGIHIKESVLSILSEKYPNATGPLLVHRLDMSTSGILLAAKTKEVHQNLQAQFIKKTVRKRYVAILDGVVQQSSGTIELPLRVDLDNRPHQLVCYEHGKMAKTEWELIEIKDGRSKVYFYPITGRTHQLRVHAAHPLGLNTPILGDDLYGNLSERLCLHADQLEITHPITKQRMTFNAAHPF